MPFKIRIIDVVFSLTIFSLFAYKVCSLAKQYLIPFLKKHLREEREAQTNLIEKENLIISNQHKIEIQIRQQHKLLNTLEKNMQTWHQFLLDQKNAKESAYQQIKFLINAKRETQQKNYVLTHICKETLPAAIELAEKELRKRYIEKNGASLETILRDI
jgi:phenylalanyl-tRNA synthetase alpha subunit